MKNFLTLIFILSSIISSAQILPVNIVGDWHATCAIEQTSDSSATFCGICPTIVNENNSSLTVASFNINFSDKELKILYDGSTSTIPFNFDKEHMKLSFTEKGLVYNFSVLQLEVLDKIILKSANGTLLYLERRKERGQ